MQKAILSRELSLLFLAPALVFVAVFLLYPFFSIFQMSFTNQTLVGANAVNPQYVGLQNYLDLFNAGDWMRRGEMGHSLWLTAQFVAGHPMSAMAGALGVELEKVHHYRLNPGARAPKTDDIRRARRLMFGAVGLSAIGLLLILRER